MVEQEKEPQISPIAENTEYLATVREMETALGLTYSPNYSSKDHSPKPSVGITKRKKSAKVILTVTSGSLEGQKFKFDSRTTCLIGRAKDCNPQLPNDKANRVISRYHCLLDINPPNIRVRDLGSKNGTYVNGEKIGQRQIGESASRADRMRSPEYDLKEKDKFQLGNTVFRVTIERGSQDNPSVVKPSLDLLSIINNTIAQAATDKRDKIALKDYKIIRSLGKGAFSEVFLVLNQQTGQLAALKVMQPQESLNTDNKEIFLREVANTHALNHPNIIRLLDYGYANNIFFFVLEYCEGGNVAELMRQKGGRLSLDEAMVIILQTLDALEYAHNAEIPFAARGNGTFRPGRGLVHQDIKPRNIFLEKKGDTQVVKLGDYGLAKAFDQAGFSGQSRSGARAGTLSFIPRQQVLDLKYCQPDADVWAVAACLYNLLTGTFPRDFAQKDSLLAVLQNKAVPIRERNASIPKALASIIDSALIDDPEINFKSAADLKKALTQSANQ